MAFKVLLTAIATALTDIVSLAPQALTELQALKTFLDTA